TGTDRVAVMFRQPTDRVRVLFDATFGSKAPACLTDVTLLRAGAKDAPGLQPDRVRFLVGARDPDLLREMVADGETVTLVEESGGGGAGLQRHTEKLTGPALKSGRLGNS